jgi:hypothetical protein
VVRDEDIGRRLYRPSQLYRAYGGPDELPWGKVEAIIDMVDRSPTAWTPRLIYEEIRETGRHDIPEELVHLVMNAMSPTDRRR